VPQIVNSKLQSIQGKGREITRQPWWLHGLRRAEFEERNTRHRIVAGARSRGTTDPFSGCGAELPVHFAGYYDCPFGRWLRKVIGQADDVLAGTWIASDLDENTLAVKQGHSAPAKGNIRYGEQQRRVGGTGERREQPPVDELLYGHAANVNVLDQLGDEL